MKTSKSYSFLLLILLWVSGCDTTMNVKAPGSNYFLKYFGNEGAQQGVDFIVNTADNTYVLFGTTKIGDADAHFYLVKADAGGNVVWEKTFGTGDCQARDIELTSNGDIVVLGNIRSAGRSDYDIYMNVLKDSITLFEQTAGFVDSLNFQLNEQASAITETSDGFMIAGSTGHVAGSNLASFITREAFVYRVNSDLSQYDQNLWPPAPGYGQGTQNVATKVITVTGDPNAPFYVFGYSKFNKGPQTDFDFWYFGLDAGGVAGNTNWLGTQPKDQKLFSVATNSSTSGFLLGGIEVDPLSGDGIYAVKLGNPPLNFDLSDYGQLPPSNLQIELGKPESIINPVMPNNQFVSMCLLKDGSFLVLTNDATTLNSNILLTKRSGSGGPRWSSPVVFGGQGDDFAGAVQELPDGKIVILGTMTVGQASANGSETKMVLVKVNQDGQFAD